MKKTLISHFYNEEYMLPWFLNHHKQIFDHGIMIDYHSTDRSVEVIKKICPTWDIVTSRNQDFQADTIDTEVNDIERNIEGWKICLNVTEQLIGDYSILDDSPRQWLLPTVFIVDTDRENLVTQDRPLYEQKHWGFSFKDSQRDFLERRSRSIHNVPVFYPPNNTPECMGPGRHYHSYNTDQLVIFYYGWSYIKDQGIDRKTQILPKIHETNSPHHRTKDQFLSELREQKHLCSDLSENLRPILEHDKRTTGQKQ
jgi:hypothetical protein